MKTGTVTRAVFFGVILAGIALPAAATPILDGLDTADNLVGWVFPTGPGNDPSTATDNGDGTVTLTRQEAGLDAGVDWYSDGDQVSLAPDHLQLEIYFADHPDNDFYSISLIFLQGLDFKGEVFIATDSNSSAPLITPDVLALTLPEWGADRYFVKFRINPFEEVGASFRLDAINAVPEPVSALCALAVLPLMLRRRRNGANG